jgi:hypothetical protein
MASDATVSDVQFAGYFTRSAPNAAVSFSGTSTNTQSTSSTDIWFNVWFEPVGG